LTFFAPPLVAGCDARQAASEAEQARKADYGGQTEVQEAARAMDI